MTNYNERLDEILARLHQQYEMQFGMHKQQFNNKKIKQAITSLIKELVAEAKPSKKRVGDEVAENRSYTGERLFNATIDEFEQNLLKALEEV
jgi:hypothetical protein